MLSKKEKEDFPKYNIICFNFSILAIFDANRVPLNPTTVPFTSSAVPTQAPYNPSLSAASPTTPAPPAGSYGQTGYAPTLEPTVAPSLAPGYPSTLASTQALQGNLGSIGTTAAPALANGFQTAAPALAGGLSAFSTGAPALSGAYNGLQATGSPLISNAGLLGYNGGFTTAAPAFAGGLINPTGLPYTASSLSSFAPGFANGFSAYNNPLLAGIAPTTLGYSGFAGNGISPFISSTIAPQFAGGYSTIAPQLAGLQGTIAPQLAGFQATIAPQLAGLQGTLAPQFASGLSAYSSPLLGATAPGFSLGYSGLGAPLVQNAALSALAAPTVPTIGPATTTIAPTTVAPAAANAKLATEANAAAAAGAAAQTKTRIQAALAQRLQAGPAASVAPIAQGYSAYSNPGLNIFSGYQQGLTGFPNSFGLNPYSLGVGSFGNYNNLGLNLFKKKKAAKKA